MNRSLAVAGVAALLVTCFAACGGDDSNNEPTSSDSGADGTTPFEASVDDANAADGTVAESGSDDTADGNVADTGADGSIADTGTDGHVADTGADGNVADTGADGSLAEAGLDSGIADAHADSAATDAGLDAAVEAEAGPPACTVNAAAPTVVETVSDAAAVSAQTGGTLVSGTYFLTSFTYVGGNPGCAGGSIKWTLVVTPSVSSGSGTFAEATESPVAAASVPNCAIQPYATSGIHLLAEDGGLSPTTYTASPTHFTLATADNGVCGSVVTVFTKQ